MTDGGATVADEAPRRPQGESSLALRMARVFLENRLASIGGILIVVISLFCFAGPLFYHTNQVAGNLLNVNLPPGPGHPLGTDGVGYDVLGRLMAGGQSSLEIGVAVGVVSTMAGAAWGAISGYLGGIPDAIMMRIVDTILAIPAIFLFIYLATIVRPNVWLLIAVLSALSWLGPARLVRGEALSLRSREYAQAVAVMGGSRIRVVVRHIIPNAIGTIVVNATFQIADAILVLATLSFLGFGLPPPAPTWGGMLANGTQYLADGYWWQIYPAGILIVVTVVAFNFIGDALRDALDVRLQRR